MKQFLKNGFFYLTPALLILMLIAFFGDAGSIYYKRGIYKKVAAAILSNQFVYNSPNLNERLLQKEIIEKQKICPDIITLGSSRVMQLDNKIVGKTKKFRNNGVSGCSIEDMAAILQLYKEKGCIPGTVILGLDPWSLNKGNEQPRYKSIQYSYLSFFNYDDSKFRSATLIENIRYFKQILTPSYIKLSFPLLFSDKMIIRDTLMQGFYAKLPDGSIQYAADFQNPSDAERKVRAKGYISPSIYGIENFDVLDKQLMNEFSGIVKFLLSKQVKIIFFLVPYHPIVYDYLHRNPKYKNVDSSELYFVNLAKNYKISICGSFNPHILNIPENAFLDGMHINKTATEIIIKTVLR